MESMLSMNNLVYVGNSDFAVEPLKGLIESDFQVKLVISQNDKERSRGKVSPTPVKIFAEENNLEVFTTDEINGEEAIRQIDEANPDYIIVVSFGQFIGPELRDKYQDRIINVHASILPKYRGASPIQASLYNGEDVTGVSIMLIDEKVDTGDVLNICRLEIKDDHNYINLSEDLSKLGAKCLVETLNNFDEFYKNRMKQDDSKSTYAGFITKEMGHIDFNDSSEEIINKFKAFYAWPKLFFKYKGENVKVWDLKVSPRIDGFDNGQVIKAKDDGLFVNCSDKCIIFTELQFPGKKRMKVSDYLRGNNIEKVYLD